MTRSKDIRLSWRRVFQVLGGLSVVPLAAPLVGFEMGLEDILAPNHKEFTWGGEIVRGNCHQVNGKCPEM